MAVRIYPVIPTEPFCDDDQVTVNDQPNPLNSASSPVLNSIYKTKSFSKEKLFCMNSPLFAYKNKEVLSMKPSIPLWQMAGFVFTGILGTFFHFLFDVFNL